jgi:peptide/nickel transport system substrate-binding protein
LASRSWRRATLGVVPIAAIAALVATSASSSASTRHATASSSLGTVIFGTLPPTGGTPNPGAKVTQGQLTGQTPLYIFPIVPGAQSTPGTDELITSLFMPLYGGPTGAKPEYQPGLSAAAGPPKALNGGKTYQITLKSGLKWSNGTPVTGNDVVFDIDLLKAAVKESAANWGQYTTGQFPVSVTSATAKGNTVTIKLNKAYNPGYFLNNQLQVTNYGVYPLPSKAWNVTSAAGKHVNNWSKPKVAKQIYDYLNKLGGQVGQFTNALWKTSDGPFTLGSYNTTNNSFVLKPYAKYGGAPKPKNEVDVNTYTSFTAELNAVKSGGLDVMVGFDSSQIPQMSSLKSDGILAYGGPGWGWFGGELNFKNTTNNFDKVVKQLYVRQALQYLINQPGDIQGVYKGAAVAAYGPIPSAPTSPYTPKSATHPYYPYSPKKAVSLLKSHGWKVVPNGTTTCQKPGTGKSECGAGIPKGTPISFVWANQPQSVSSVGALESEALSSVAKAKAGINITLQTKTFNFLVSNYNNANPAAAKYKNQWGVNNYGGLFMNYFPTQEGAWNTTGAFNTGSYSDPTANNLMTHSVFGKNASAVTKEADYFSKNLPVLFFPDQDYMLAANSKTVSSTSPDGWTAPTQQQFFPQFWFAKK